MATAITSRMMPLATPRAPGEKCSSLVSRPPRTSRSAATVAAVTSILRSTWRLVASGIPCVTSRNGTRAILGPMPIRRNRNVSMTNAASSDSSSFIPGFAPRGTGPGSLALPARASVSPGSSHPPAFLETPTTRSCGLLHPGGVSALHLISGQPGAADDEVGEDADVGHQDDQREPPHLAPAAEIITPEDAHDGADDEKDQ